MPIILNCQRCGQPLPPLSEDDEKLLRSGKPFVAQHDVCPDDRAAVEAAKPRQRRFEARVRIVEVVTPDAPAAPASGLIIPGVFAPPAAAPVQAETVELAGFTAWVDAPNLPDAMRPLALALGERWMEVEVHAPLVDTPDIADLEQPEITTLPREGETAADTIERHVQAQYGEQQ